MNQNMGLGLKCTLCHSVFKEEIDLFTCPTCGEEGILDVQYNYDAIRPLLTKKGLSENKDRSMWRYLPLLPVNALPEVPLLHVGGTPLYPATQLGKLTKQLNVYIKDDGLNPTGSMKDRASIIAVVKALEEKKTTICCSSTGNAASSLAGNAAKVGLKTLIFVPERAPKGKLAQLMIYGADLKIVKGDYKAAFTLSKQAIEHYGFYNRNAAINPYLVEGKKTVALEICEQLEFKPIQWVIVSVGDGCTIAGVYKGFYDMKQLGLIDSIPKLLGVQASGCQPLLEAFESGNPPIECEENTLADSIAVGIPRNPVKALAAVKDSGGRFISVTDEEILEGMCVLGREEGIFAEPASSASFAGYLKATQENLFNQEDVIVIINTGNGLKDIANGLKAIQLPEAILPELKYVEHKMKG